MCVKKNWNWTCEEEMQRNETILILIFLLFLFHNIFLFVIRCLIQSFEIHRQNNLDVMGEYCKKENSSPPPP